MTLTPSNNSTSEIKSRLLLASAALGKLQKVWSGKDITLSTKLRLLNVLVYPVLLYGSEIWTIKTNDLKKLVAFTMRCYRKVLNITWKDKIRNEDVLFRISFCKFKPKRILARITESQLSWFGHVCRMSNMASFPNAFLWKWFLVPTDQGRDGKMISLLAAPSSRNNAEGRNRWAVFGHGANVLWDMVQR